jgi:hypothetical protein
MIPLFFDWRQSDAGKTRKGTTFLWLSLRTFFLQERKKLATEKGRAKIVLRAKKAIHTRRKDSQGRRAARHQAADTALVATHYFLALAHRAFLVTKAGTFSSGWATATILLGRFFPVLLLSPPLGFLFFYCRCFCCRSIVPQQRPSFW